MLSSITALGVGNYLYLPISEIAGYQEGHVPVTPQTPSDMLILNHNSSSHAITTTHVGFHNSSKSSQPLTSHWIRLSNTLCYYWLVSCTSSPCHPRASAHPFGILVLSISRADDNFERLDMLCYVVLCRLNRSLLSPYAASREVCHTRTGGRQFRETVLHFMKSSMKTMFV